MAKTKKSKTKGVPAISTELTMQQQIASQALAYCGYRKGRKVKDGATTVAARAAGVSRALIYIWLKIPEFVDEIEAHMELGYYEAWVALRKQVNKGSERAIEMMFDRMRILESPKAKIELLKHELRMKELERKAELGLGLDQEEAVYRVVIGEYGTDIPNPETEH